MKRGDFQLRWTNIYTTDRKRLGNINSTFTAMICPLGTCRIFSTTPYAPRPSSIIGSRSSAFTSKFCRREKSCTRKEERKLDTDYVVLSLWFLPSVLRIISGPEASGLNALPRSHSKQKVWKDTGNPIACHLFVTGNTEIQFQLSFQMAQCKLSTLCSFCHASLNTQGIHVLTDGNQI